MNDQTKLELINELIEIGLQYNVDYIYILQDIQKLIKGQKITIQVENYLD